MNKKDIQVFMREFKNFREIILELCYPTTCVLCGKLDARGMCAKCKKKHPMIQEPRCMKCGKPIRDMREEYCSDCKIHKKIFKQGRSIWIHENEVKQSIYKFKYKNRRIYAEQYAKLLVEENTKLLRQWKPECLIPIPVHANRKRKRGYNQAEVLAKMIQGEIERQLGVALPVETRMLYRKKETLYQKKLDDKQRRKNISGAFQIREMCSLPTTVLLIDDIYTTGATLQEISKILTRAGVQNVFFLTISIGQGF